MVARSGNIPTVYPQVRDYDNRSFISEVVKLHMDMWHSSSVTMQAEKQKGQRKQQFVSRTIFHPSFKNVSMPDAISFLDTQNETISWVIRPSNKGTQQLSITMKVRICSTRVHRARLHDTYIVCIACLSVLHCCCIRCSHMLQ